MGVLIPDFVEEVDLVLVREQSGPKAVDRRIAPPLMNRVPGEHPTAVITNRLETAIGISRKPRTASRRATDLWDRSAGALDWLRRELSSIHAVTLACSRICVIDHRDCECFVESKGSRRWPLGLGDRLR